MKRVKPMSVWNQTAALHRWLLAITAAGAGLTGRALAQSTQFDFCRTADAGARLVLPPSPATVEAKDAAGGYFGAGCNRFVVDISVPPSAGASAAPSSVILRAGAFRLAGGHPLGDGFAAPAAAGQCDSYTQLTTVYKKTAGEKDFIRLSAVTTRGEWHETECALRIPQWSYGPPAKGTETYRLAMSVKMSGRWLPVRVTATRQQPSR
jgi:hypothetical protein